MKKTTSAFPTKKTNFSSTISMLGVEHKMTKPQLKIKQNNKMPSG